MHVTLKRRADGLGDQTVECERVDVVMPHGDGAEAVIEFDPNMGENGEYRIVVEDECVWSYVL